VVEEPTKTPRGLWVTECGACPVAAPAAAASTIAVFLRALREHEDWAPALPGTAVIRLAEQNRAVLDQLDARIAEIRRGLDRARTIDPISGHAG
jgi:hypothetical protein